MRVSVRDVARYAFGDLPTTLPEWFAWLEEARAEVPKEYHDALKCVLSFDEGYCDSGATASLEVWYERPETDDEMIVRVSRGISYIQSQEASERATFERLKQKYL